ncbi:MAG: hypothetical protein GXO60_04700 [Epsilonproteobacteria bacterium]|nr:hypothetical protein [Campylobacterota bacterium]
MSDFKNFVDDCLAQKSQLHAYQVGVIEPQIIKVLEEQNIEISTIEIYLTQKGLTHLYRPTKRSRNKALLLEDIYTIPTVLKYPSALFLDTQQNRLNLLYCFQNSKKCLKLIVDTKSYVHRGKKLTIVKTAGYIYPYDMKNSKYILIQGVWEMQGETVTLS